MAFITQYDIYLAVKDKLDCFCNAADALRAYNTAKSYLKLTAKVHILERRRRHGMDSRFTKAQCLRGIEELLKEFEPGDDDPIEDSDDDDALSTAPVVNPVQTCVIEDSQATVLIG